MYLIDSANVKAIESAMEFFTFDGVTTNPTLMARERRTDFLHHIKDIQKTIGPKKLFIQLNAETADLMVEEAKILAAHAEPPFALKIPATREGYKAMRELASTHEIAATAVVSLPQALMSIAAGARTIIIYVNRMISTGLLPYELIKKLKKIAEQNRYDITILGASFKSSEEIHNALIAGCHKVTISPELAETLFLKPLTERSVKQFTRDFQTRYKAKSLKER